MADCGPALETGIGARVSGPQLKTFKWELLSCDMLIPRALNSRSHAIRKFLIIILQGRSKSQSKPFLCVLSSDATREVPITVIFGSVIASFKRVPLKE